MAAPHFTAGRLGPWLELNWRAPAKTKDGLPQRGAITPWLCIWPGDAATPPAGTPCPRRMRVGAAQAPGARGQARVRLDQLWLALPGAPSIPATTPSALQVALVFANASGHWGAPAQFRLVPTVPVAPPPAWVPARVLRGGIALSWRPAASSRVRIERRRLGPLAPPGAAAPAASAGPWRPVADLPTGNTHYLDGEIRWGQAYAYRLESIAGRGRAEVTSLPSAVLTVAARNRFPPAAPSGLEAIPSPPTKPGGAYVVALSWLPPPPAPPVTTAGYNVYRRRGQGPWRRRNPALLLAPVFSDSISGRAGACFAYAVSAVGANGVEGPKSAPVSVVLPPPAEPLTPGEG